MKIISILIGLGSVWAVPVDIPESAPNSADFEATRNEVMSDGSTWAPMVEAKVHGGNNCETLCATFSTTCTKAAFWYNLKKDKEFKDCKCTAVNVIVKSGTDDGKYLDVKAALDDITGESMLFSCCQAVINQQNTDAAAIMDTVPVYEECSQWNTVNVETVEVQSDADDDGAKENSEAELTEGKGFSSSDSSSGVLTYELVSVAVAVLSGAYFV